MFKVEEETSMWNVSTGVCTAGSMVHPPFLGEHAQSVYSGPLPLTGSLRYTYSQTQYTCTQSQYACMFTITVYSTL